MYTATPSSISQPTVVRRVALLALAVVTADQVARAFALGVSEGNPAGAFATRTSSLGLGFSEPRLPTIALLAAIGIVAVGVGGLRRAQAGLLPAWVPGFLIGGAMSTVLDRFAGGAVAEHLATPWSVVTVAGVAIAAGTIGWITTDRGRVRDHA